MFSSAVIQYRCHQVYLLVSTLRESCQHSLVNIVPNLSTLQDNCRYILLIARTSFVLQCDRNIAWPKFEFGFRFVVTVFDEIDFKNTIQLYHFTMRFRDTNNNLVKNFGLFRGNVTLNVSIFALLIRGNYICVEYKQTRDAVPRVTR